MAAQIDPASVSLPRPIVSGGAPRINPPSAGRIVFDTASSSAIAASGSADIVGAPGEAVGGWRLGWFQLQFIEDNYAKYRGRTEREGSTLMSWSHLRLCRDTDETVRPPSLYYDPPAPSLSPSGRGTFTVPAGTLLPASGRLTMHSGFEDAPSQSFPTVVRNTQVRPPADNLLHHVDIAFHFCTLLVAESPRHAFTFLKHFYWNIRWEAHFTPSRSGAPTWPPQIDHVELNVQREVHSGVPRDQRFAGRQLDTRLPVSNLMAQRNPRVQFGNGWELSLVSARPAAQQAAHR